MEQVYCFVLKFNDSVWCHLYSTNGSNHWAIFFCYNFQFYNFNFLIISISLLRFSIILLRSREFIFAYWSIFMIAALKSLTDNSNIWITLVLVSILGALFVCNCWRFSLEDFAASCWGYIGGNIENQETHYYIILQFWRFLARLPFSFHLSETPYACLCVTFMSFFG